MDTEKPNQPPQDNSDQGSVTQNQAAQIVNPETQILAEGPHVFVSNNVNPQEPEKKQRIGFKVIALGILAFALLILFGGFGALYLIAYEKIKIEKYPQIQEKIAAFVISLPFMPKTPKYILGRSFLAHQKVTKQTFDVSLAVDSQDLASQLGLSSMDFLIRGGVDYSDPNDVKFSVDASLTKELSAEFRKNSNILFFKINKLPGFLLAFLGLGATDLDPVLGQWVAYDTTPLDTEARRQIQDKEVESQNTNPFEENLQKYVDEEVLKKLKAENVTENGIKLYKVYVEADPSLIDHLGRKLEEERKLSQGAALYPNPFAEETKLSEIVKSLRWEVYTDQDQYFIRKIVIASQLEYDAANFGSLFLGNAPNTGGPANLRIVFAGKFDNFGEEVLIEIPSSYVTFEEFSEEISEIMKAVYTSPSFEIPSN